jgi:hypothetical protein
MAPPSKTKKSSASKPAKNKNTCFVIMPFGGWFDSYYENIYVPAIDSAGMAPKRADGLYRPSAIVNDIWELTNNAKIILAELSGRNPNVFYEVGLAHAIANPVVLITDTVDALPFDLRYWRHIIYDKNEPKWGDILRKAIKKSIEETLNSPIQSILPSFLKVDNKQKPSVTMGEKEFLYMKQRVEAIEQAMRTRIQPNAYAAGKNIFEMPSGGLGFISGSGSTPTYSLVTAPEFQSWVAQGKQSQEDWKRTLRELNPGKTHIVIEQDATD